MSGANHRQSILKQCCSQIHYNFRIRYLTQLPGVAGFNPAPTTLFYRCADTLLRLSVLHRHPEMSMVHWGYFLRCKLHGENQTILSLIQTV